MTDSSRPAGSDATPPNGGAAGAPGSPSPRRGLSRGAIIGLAAGGGALLLIVIAVVVVTAVGLVNAAVPRPTAADPRQVVRSYLTALSQGKASVARGYLTDDQASGTLLTAAVLKQSQAIAPIRRITVGKAGGSSYFPQVPVTYSLGSHRVHASFRLYRNDDKSYSITGGLAPLNPISLTGLDLTVDGVKLTMPENGLKLFPGAHRIAITTPSFALAGNGTVELAGPDADLDPDALKPKLTDAALATFRHLVSDAVKRCMAQKTLKAGCGLTLTSPLSDGSTIQNGTVQRSSTPEVKAKLAALQPRSDSETPTLVSASVGESVDVKVDGATRSGQHGRFRILFGPSLGTAYVDFAAAKPEVSWR